MRPSRGSLLVSLLLGVLPSALLAAEPRAKLVLVTPPWAASDRAFVAEAALIERSLAQYFELVPLAEYERAGRGLGIKPLALYGDESATVLGRLAGASRVAILKPYREKLRRRAERQMAALLIDVATGASLVDLIEPVERGGQAQAKAASEVVLAFAPFRQAAGLASPREPNAGAPAVAAMPVPAPVLVPVPTPASPNAPTAPALVPVSPKAAPPAVAAAPGAGAVPLPDHRSAASVPAAPQPAADAKAAPPPALVAPPAAAPTPRPALVPPPAPPAAPRPAPPPAPVVDERPAPSFWDAEGRLPNGVTFAGGALVYERASTISTAGVSRLHYGAEGGERAPIFARSAFDLALFPGRWHRGRIGPIGGLFVFGHLEAGTAPTQTSRGNVVRLGALSWRTGLGYRSPLWRGPKAMAAALRVGVHQYVFGTKAGVNYPAVGLTGATLGLDLEVPLDTRHVAIVGSGAVVLAPRAMGGLATLGSSLTSSFAATAEGGLRFAVGPVDIYLVAAWERYMVQFAGQSALTSNLVTQYTNAQLIDQSIGGRAQLGLHF